MTKTILIIDDEPDIREYLMTLLKDHGYITLSVDENETIIDAVIKLRPDLIILDIMMPERSGLSLYRELRSTPVTTDIPIVLLTGVSSDTEFLRTGISEFLEKESISSPNRYIDKPIDIPEFLSSIKSLLD